MTHNLDDWVIHAACLSSVGRVREHNEDSYRITPDENLFIVSDGMGGEQAGEIASRVVVTVLPELINRHLSDTPSPSVEEIELALRNAIVELSQRLRAESAPQLGLRGMGATVALAWLRTPTAHLAHMGDSRIYLFRGNTLIRLTEDHTVVALLLKYGDITVKTAKIHPAQGRLSRYVGIEGEVYPDVQTISLQDGDRFVLCSDGLTSLVPDDQIARLLQINILPEKICEALIDAANAAGGTDNITALAINYVKRENIPGDNKA